MILIIKHVVKEGAGLLADFLKSKNCQLKTIELEEGQELPESLDNFKAVISMGGPMNVYEESKYPFLRQENSLIKEALEKKIPFLGVCLGAQLLAKAKGALVKKGPIKELGWFKVNLTTEGLADPLFLGSGKELDVFQWHEDTFEIPKGGVLVAKGHAYPNQAFRLGECAWGLQFHLEAKPGMVESWLKPDLKTTTLDAGSQAQEIIAKSYKLDQVVRRQAEIVCANFYRVIK